MNWPAKTKDEFLAFQLRLGSDSSIAYYFGVDESTAARHRKRFELPSRKRRGKGQHKQVRSHLIGDFRAGSLTEDEINTLYHGERYDRG